MKIELKEIHKRFGPVRANNGVSLSAEPGTLHGLLGENGAGKSTLMKVLSGYISPDRGEILFDGLPVRFTSPAQAVAMGVGMLHQDPLDFPALSVLDNFLLGSSGRLRLNRRRTGKELSELADQFSFKLEPDFLVSTLSIGERQQLEILRLLWLGVRVLILDEPTTAISAQQKSILFSALQKLALQGKTILFVSHKLEEVKSLCSKLTVMAHGNVAGEETIPCSTERLVQMMFGRPIAVSKRSKRTPGTPLLELEHITASDWRLEVKDFSLTVRTGEVIGLAGLEGSGQHLVLRVCAGLLRPSAGRVRIGGADMTRLPYHRFLESGVAYLSAGRLEEGLIAGLTWMEHAALAESDPSFWINWAAAEQMAAQRIETYRIKGQPSNFVEELSGGNQQRTLLALLPSQPKLLLMEHPMRGLDMESTEYIWNLLLNRTQQGTAIIFTSSELDELIERSDRILVFFSGKVKILDSWQTGIEELEESIGGKGFG